MGMSRFDDAGTIGFAFIIAVTSALNVNFVRETKGICCLTCRAIRSGFTTLCPFGMNVEG